MALVALANNLRGKPGYKTSFGCLIGLLGFTLAVGPQFDNNLGKYVLAGTSALVSVEVLTHALDTINMRSKILHGPKYSFDYLLKADGLASLFKGIQPIIYGYTYSSFVYFYVYAKSKNTVKNWLGIEDAKH